MTEQNSKKSFPERVETAARLLASLPNIEARIAAEVKAGNMPAAHYAREQLNNTKAIIYALQHNRVAKTQADVDRLMQHDG